MCGAEQHTEDNAALEHLHWTLTSLFYIALKKCPMQMSKEGTDLSSELVVTFTLNIAQSDRIRNERPFFNHRSMRVIASHLCAIFTMNENNITYRLVQAL